jgi:hypothetical protein
MGLWPMALAAMWWPTSTLLVTHAMLFHMAMWDSVMRSMMTITPRSAALLREAAEIQTVRDETEADRFFRAALIMRSHGRS